MKIICIGRNYRKHIEELNNQVPEQPIIFLKPESSLTNDASISFPKAVGEVHYECELVLKVNNNIPLASFSSGNFKNYVSEWTLGVDFTARQLQSILKDKGRPWELAKSFDNSIVVGTFLPIPYDIMNECHFEFLQKDSVLQQGLVKDMLFSLEDIIQFANQYFSLQKGDLIFTGTPEGVGKVISGVQYSGVLNKQEVLSFRTA